MLINKFDSNYYIPLLELNFLISVLFLCIVGANGASGVSVYPIITCNRPTGFPSINKVV